MMEKCYDEAVLQAFLDNELPSELSQSVARHLVDCDPCAELLAQVEEETAFAFTALEQEFNTLVPTQRLWTKINESIETQNRQRSLWQRLAAFASGFSLLNPQVLAFGSLLMVVGVVSALIVMKGSNAPDGSDLAVVQPSVTTVSQTKVETTTPPISGKTAPAETNDFDVKPKNQVNSQFRIEKADYTERKIEKTEPRRDYYQPAVPQYLDGEESYVTTISRLEKTVNDSKDEVLNPSARFAYEKDMAVVDDTIKKMRAKVKKNPKNADAKEILFASYQNKIELLNSVNQRGELMASLR
jgi:hypothetical protein